MLKLSFSWDDGAPDDLKLVRLCEKYSIPSMLFIPNENQEGRAVLSADTIKAVRSELTAIGAHTQHHTYLTEIPLSDVRTEVVNNKKYLEDILGDSVNDFSFPGGKYNQGIFEAIKDEFKTYRTADTMCSCLNKEVIRPTFHFYPRGKKSLLLNSLRHKDALFPAVLEKISNCDDYFELLRLLIDVCAESKKEFFIHIWGHSWELEQFGLWQELEKMLSWISEHYMPFVYKYPAPYINI
ncbi:polysaccharide deacetylase family protein [Treponema brennaborense]|uniref:Polysaccharide deacetylase n=1 Tax=Treponema brennaborense (strain DSM 12168 / CIP 105900 / DD5/3) TaxID=906968 RepID=F4LL68_TREBD|nr:polysaccharide deacetylase family protein [Treponema brennaborense]AEE17642.1 polysaccharide deacetylase [Treponema brennaborense DSM 12168]